MPEARPLVAVVGPTAAGKSELAIGLARTIDGEVINADSMQLYRGMDIGTAKLRPAEWHGVRHHLLDVWDVTYPAAVAEFKHLAAAAVADVRSRARQPVLAGGSGLYVRAILDRLEFPRTDVSVRDRLERELADTGPVALHRRLEALDPDAAARILPSNGRRIVRALEVVELTGRQFSASLPEYSYAAPAVQIGLSVPRAELDRRIEARVELMWERGFVDEVRALEACGLRRGRTASRALGYAQVLRFLAGECTLEQARVETVRATRRFARRQESWFRRDPRVHWLPFDAADLLSRSVELAVGGSERRDAASP
jgi:tRNA dimethylallyltransferase